MTKKLQDLLDLPDSKEIIDEATEQQKQQKKYEVAEQKGIEATLAARQENFPLQVKVKKQ